MRKLIKSLACILLILILSIGMVSATDETGGGSFSYVIEDILVK